MNITPSRCGIRRFVRKLRGPRRRTRLFVLTLGYSRKSVRTSILNAVPGAKWEPNRVYGHIWQRQ